MGSAGARSRPPALGPRAAAARRPSDDCRPRTGRRRPTPVDASRSRGQRRGVERVRQHPYVRLALNSSFSALWAGQLISLFGDRIHQIALVAVVVDRDRLGGRGRARLLRRDAAEPAPRPDRGHVRRPLGPQGGDGRQRHPARGVVLLIPIAAVTNIVLVYPLVFLVTTISIFFRPARVAILPRIVPEEDLLSANSALWVGETIADVVGYPLAGIFVALLGSAVPLAFWFDARPTSRRRRCSPRSSSTHAPRSADDDAGQGDRASSPS